MEREKNGAAWQQAEEEAYNPTWRQLLEEGTRILSEAGVAEAELDAWYLLSAAFGIDRVHFYLDQNTEVRRERLESGDAAYRDGLLRRAARIPLQQILGNQEFMGMEFSVNEHVLIPRQDTETLVEAVLRDYGGKDISLLDVCTGSGCIAISLAVLGGYQRVTAADISLEALKVAKKNAKRLFLIQKGTLRSQSFQLSDKPWKLELKTWNPDLHSLTLLQSNLLEQIENGEKYDVIVSNPPYIPSAVIEELEPEVRDYEPRIALDGQEDGLYFYRALALQCSRHLKTGGAVYFEIGYDQAEAVERILAIAGYREIELIRDEPGLERVVKASWNR